ncbi:MAG: 23S rRNA (pseudouridine(1915)-N(3))-methyltransferase RlmH [Pseudomonadota bacterium]
MNIRLLAVGGKMPDWVNAGFQDYQRRLPPHLKLQLTEIPLPKRRASLALEKSLAQEGEALLKAAAGAQRVIALDVAGKQFSTRQLADQLDEWLGLGGDVALLIGGPDGLDARVLQHCQQRWSLGKLTLPHPLVRVVLAEQLYRAHSILVGHPYHRE